MRDKNTGEPIDCLLATFWIVKKFCERRPIIGWAEAYQLPDCLRSFCPLPQGVNGYYKSRVNGRQYRQIRSSRSRPALPEGNPGMIRRFPAMSNPSIPYDKISCVGFLLPQDDQPVSSRCQGGCFTHAQESPGTEHLLLQY